MATSQQHLTFVRPFMLLASLGIVLGMLYWGQAVLIPLALAILITFLLAPVVTVLQRRGLGRVPAVIIVAACAFTMIGVLGWIVAAQTRALVDSIPEYEQNVRAKIASIREAGRGGFVDRLQNLVDRLGNEFGEHQAASDELKGVQPVRVVDDRGPFNLTQLWSILGPLLEPFANAGLVVVLVIFLLIRREDMRDRLISLLGLGRLTLTTKALDDAGHRISRYLLMQLIINSSYGLAVGIGLVVLQVPYALLWGFLAAVLRYIPYLGPWLAAILPVTLTLLISDGWWTPVLVVALFLVLELVSNLVMEPLLYGRHVGVSETAALITLAFWTWLWGPIGLVLAYPLTVCLAVLGRFVPPLKFFDIMLSDRPPLEPYAGFYQRLLAKDEDEAADIAEDYLGNHAIEKAYDDIFIPALNLMRRDADNDLLGEEEHKQLITNVQEIAEELASQVRLIDQARLAATEGTSEGSGSALPKITVLGCPARDATDEAALQIFEHLLDPAKCDLVVTASALLSTEVVQLVEEQRIRVACIGSVPPGGLSHAKYLCMRLRARFPDLKIVVGRWGLRDGFETDRQQLQSAGADYVGFTLSETRDQMINVIQLEATREVQENAQAPSAEPVKQSA